MSSFFKGFPPITISLNDKLRRNVRKMPRYAHPVKPCSGVSAADGDQRCIWVLFHEIYHGRGDRSENFLRVIIIAHRKIIDLFCRFVIVAEAQVIEPGR